MDWGRGSPTGRLRESGRGQRWASTEEEGLGLDPMSQTAYGVVLVRSSDEPMIFRVLTVVLVLLFALAGYWAVRFDLMKREWA